MMKSREKRRRMAAARGMSLMLAGLIAVCGGCGQEQVPVEEVELLDPVGVAVNYESAARRNLYDASIYSGLVCPYVEEYGLEEAGSFDAYDALPGDAVAKGGRLMHNNTERYEEQIESLEESIADMEESFQEFMEDNQEALNEALGEQKYYNQIMDNLEKQRPQQYVTDPATGESVPNEDYQSQYDEWYKGGQNYGFWWCDNNLRRVNQTVMELEEAIKERQELYELDHRYSLLRLDRVKEDMQSATLVSGIAGNVANIRVLSEGNWVGANQVLAAVCDPSQLVIRCDYLSNSTIKGAEDVYALVNGKRYEVAFEEMDSQEYQRLKNQNGTVYSAFDVVSGQEELQLGDYAVIVVKKRVRENVVTVPRDAIVQEGSIRYVYLLDGAEKVYTEVTTGMTDGMYTEILSGVQEGDKVLTDQAVTAGEDTVKVTRGSIKGTFSETGYLFYPSTEIISNPVEYGTCYFESMEVNIYQQVKKGDVLARVWVVPDEAEIGRNEQKLVRLRQRLDDLKQEDVTESSEAAIEQMEESIQDLEELIADMKADAQITEITAPRNGIIHSYGDYNLWAPEEGAILPGDADLFELSDEGMCYIVVDDENGQLSYGNEAQVEYTDFENKKNTVTGEVVTVNKMCLSGGAEQVTLVRIAPEDVGKIAGSRESWSGFWNRSSVRVTAEIRSMDNVLLVPRKAVTESGGRTYVMVRLENGEIQYRSFIAGGFDSSNYWVIEGLTEGMELCLK